MHYFGLKSPGSALRDKKVSESALFWLKEFPVSFFGIKRCPGSALFVIKNEQGPHCL